MKKQFLYSVILLVLGFGQLIQAQTKEPKKHDPEAFDEEAALAQAKTKGIKSSELKGYVQYLKNDFSSQNALKKQGHVHTPYEGGVTGDISETVIYIQPNRPMSIGCPNMGFEQYNFTNWTGGKGTVSIGPAGGNPIYTSTGAAILNSAGNNVSIANTVNYHTIMTIPATNSVVPNQVAGGYDSLACRVSGAQTVSEIPVVSPFSFDPVSVRMNGSTSNYRACRLKYITTTSSTNQQLTFSYAVVLNDPAFHLAEESPYFKVEIRNETTNTILSGCTSYTFNPKTSLPSDSLKTSVYQINGDGVKYRKWQFYSVDLSTLPPGTAVSVNFEVGGCTQGGHAAYAYVDADCGGIGKPYANMCSGSTFATLVAPQGFVQYQWQTMPGNVLIPGATNDTLIIPNANPGTVYAVQMVTAGGCTLTLTDTVKLTTVSIINLNANSSCAGGASGSAYVQANGSNGVYNYTWTNTGTGSIVSTSQTATGLASGNYSVVVASTTCGQASANISVGVSPPFFISQNKSFCGNSTYIAKPGGSGYQWYQGSPSVLISAPNGINDTLQIATAVAGNIYTLVYTNASGCRDSIKYTLNQIAGGNTYVNHIQNVCPASANGSAVINLNTTFPSPYSYYVTGPTLGTVVTNTVTSLSTLTVSTLAAGTYSYLIDDGVCLYNSTFTITTIQTNFTITPTNTVICYPSDTAMLHLNFGNTIPTVCALSTTGGCSSPNSISIGTGTTGNTNTGNPAPYGNYDKNRREQYLFTATELLAAGVVAGNISSISFPVNSMQPVNTTSTSSSSTYIGTLPNYSIKMKCTPAQSLSTFDNTGLTQVYFGNYTPVVGLNTHILPQAYSWDGVSSILVDVCYTRNLPLINEYWTSNPITPYTNTGVVKTICFSSDGTPACGNTTGTTYTNRPNITFGNCGAVNPSTYTVSAINGSITTNYNNDSIKIVPPSTFTVPATNTPYIYTISVTNPNGGCVKTQTVAILYPAPITSITAIPTTSNICEGSQLNLSATGAVTYTWAYGSISNTVATTQSVVVTPPSTGLNTYIVTGSAPCGALPDTKTVTVNVIPKADLLISPLQDVTKCLNKNYVITTGVGSTTPGNAGTPYTYAWTTLPTNTQAPGVNTSSNYTVTSNVTTTLVVTVNGSCANPNRDTIVIKNFVDNLAISIIDSSTTCAGREFTLHSNVTGGYPGYNYGWFIDSNTSPLSTSANLTSISPANQGTYLIIVNVNDSCGYAKSASEVITVLPPCNVIIPNVITPNGDGVNDYFRIANIEHHPNTTVTLFDRWGRKVYENANYNNDWKADHLSDGTYFYVVDVPDDKKYSGFITVFHK
jgi:gliding motility-associated-like protein